MTHWVEGDGSAHYSRAAMTRTHTICAVFGLVLLAAAPASAQMYPGQGISVNPNALGGRIMVGPDGRYVQVVNGPYGPYAGVVRLHMPVHHRRARPAPDVASTAPVNAFPSLPPETQTATETPTPTPQPMHKVKTAAKPVVTAAQQPPPPPQPAPQQAAPVANQDGGIPLALDPTVALPIKKPGPATTHPKQAMAAPPTQVASIAPPTKHADTSSDLSKRSEILFARGAIDPSTDSVNKMRALAGDLNTLLSAGAQRVLLYAYGGAQGDKSSDARRLSLKRALAIRQLLIEDGVSADAIDVHAMGGSDSGAPDRVDVFVRA